MRVALLYFGIARCLEATMPGLRRHVLEPNRALDITTVAALNLPAVIDNPRSEERGIQPRADDVFQLGADHYLLARQNETAIAESLSAAQKAPDIFQDDWRSVRNLLHQLLSLKRGWQYCTEVLGGFDLYLFLRPDLDYLGTIDIASLAAGFQDDRAIALPCWNSWGGFNDRFALAAPMAATHYARRIDLVPGFCRTGRSLHGEMFLGEALDRGGCAVGLLPVEAQRIRTDGRVWTENFAAKRIYLPHRPERFARHAGNVVFDIAGPPGQANIPEEAARLPDVLDVLAVLHRRRNVARYLETQAEARTLRLAQGHAVGIGLPQGTDGGAFPGATLFPMTSAAYFAAETPRQPLNGPIDLALIVAGPDPGRALQDVAAVERFCTPASMIVLSGVLPDEEGEAEGWRVVEILRRLRPQLSIKLVRCRPASLAVVTRLEPASAVLAAAMEGEIAALATPPTAEARRAFLSAMAAEHLTVPLL